jgi:hypothetical protein
MCIIGPLAFAKPWNLQVRQCPPWINKAYKEAATFIKRRDPNVSEDGSGLTALGLGVGLYADGVNKNPDLPVEGVIVFERGYYD